MLIALASLAAVDEDFFLSCRRNIRHYLAAFRLTDYRTDRHLNDDILAVLAEAVALAAGFAGRCHKFSLIAEIHQCAHAAFADKNHIAALAAVAAIGAAVRNVFCSVKGNLTVAAVAALYMNLDSIYKHFPILLSFLGALPQTFFAAGLKHFSLKSIISFLIFPIKEDFTALHPLDLSSLLSAFSD